MAQVLHDAFLEINSQTARAWVNVSLREIGPAWTKV
jgi:hypothetical protein